MSWWWVVSVWGRSLHEWVVVAARTEEVVMVVVVNIVATMVSTVERVVVHSTTVLVQISQPNRNRGPKVGTRPGPPVPWFQIGTGL